MGNFTGLYDENNKPIHFGDKIAIDIRKSTETAKEYAVIVGKNPAFCGFVVREVMHVCDDANAFGVYVEQDKGCLIWRIDKDDPIARGVTIVEHGA